MENKVAHLEMIQVIITRMASNSFLINGWSVTLVAALFALAAANTNERFVYLAYFPALHVLGARLRTSSVKSGCFGSSTTTSEGRRMSGLISPWLHLQHGSRGVEPVSSLPPSQRGRPSGPRP